MTAEEILADPAVRERVLGHVTAWFPKEACGLLVVGSDGPDAVLADNLLDREHERDPERFPRTGEDGYLLDARLVEIEAPRRGLEVVAIFHSHVRVGAYFSDEDRAQALAPWGDPLYPGVDYVVFDARDDGVHGYRTFTWSEEQGDFVER